MRLAVGANVHSAPQFILWEYLRFRIPKRRHVFTAAILAFERVFSDIHTAYRIAVGATCGPTVILQVSPSGSAQRQARRVATSRTTCIRECAHFDVSSSVGCDCTDLSPEGGSNAAGNWRARSESVNRGWRRERQGTINNY